MSIDRRLLAAAFGLALVVTACGGSSTSTASPAPSGTPAASQPQASEAATSEAPSASEDSTATEAPSGPDASFSEGQAGDLEALLPSEAGGIKFKKESFDGANIGASGMGMDTGELAPILKANGKTIADVRMAIASPATPSATNSAVVIAFQIRGVDATKLIDLMKGSTSGTLTPATVGGKQVLKMGESGVSAVIYTKGDVLFEVILANETTLDAIVAALP